MKALFHVPVILLITAQSAHTAGGAEPPADPLWYVRKQTVRMLQKDHHDVKLTPEELGHITL